MKSLAKVSLLLAASWLLLGCEPQEQAAPQQAAPAEPVIESESDMVSYIIGMNMGNNLPSDIVALDPELVALGIKDVINGQQPRLTPEEMSTTMQALQTKIEESRNRQREQQQEAFNKASEDNLAAGKAFLDENAGKEGVVVTESGLQYKVLEEGSGPMPTAGDTVTVNYRGTLVDGSEFDSSYKRGKPATFAVSAVIPGWTEALQLMKEGAKWMLFIPPELAYGPGGTGGQIGPNATLIFEVELLQASVGSGDVEPAQ